MNQEQVWDGISKTWSMYRIEPYSDIKPYLKKFAKLKKGKLLEIGCGNCRNLVFFKNFDCYGTDFSSGQIKAARKFCKENHLKVKLKKCEAVRLPFKDCSFDYILSIALIHCLKKKNREKAVKEMYRVLKKSGKALVSVWRLDKFKGKFKYVPWKEGKYPRYYHFFIISEFKNLLEKVGFKILKLKKEKNIFAIVKK